jgi:DNA-directed RNA polymerase subunit omega
MLQAMNAEFVKQAMEKVGNANTLVNLVSRRVRQFNNGSRPLIAETGQLGAADIALMEIIEGKMSWEIPELVTLVRPAAQKRRKPQGWVKAPTPAIKAAA